MAITETGYVSPRVAYLAAPGQTTFQIPFQFFGGDLRVFVDTVLVEDGFTATGAGSVDGGNLVFAVGRTGGEAIEILRDIIPQRIADFPLSGAFDIAMLNLELTRIVLMIQELITLDAIVREEFGVFTQQYQDFVDTVADALGTTSTNAAAALAAAAAALASEAAAAGSATSAAGSASSATGSASSATASAAAAAVSAGEAASARDSASGHRLNAQNAATAAAASETAAAGSASAAAASQSAAAASAAVALIEGAKLTDGLTLAALNDTNLTGATAGDGLTFTGSAWVPGAAGGGMFKGNNGTVGSRSGDIFRVNAKSVTEDVTIAATENASAAGPLAVASGKTLTIASGGSLVIL
jgi:hypothetical protein